MITIELTKAEACAFALLAERAADEFSNHGCNDFDVEIELGLGKQEALGVVSELRRALFIAGVVGSDYLDDRHSTYLEDWLLLKLLQRRLEAAVDTAG